MKIKSKTSKNADLISFTPDEINDLAASFDLLLNKIPTLYKYKGLSELNNCIDQLSKSKE